MATDEAFAPEQQKADTTPQPYPQRPHRKQVTPLNLADESALIQHLFVLLLILCAEHRP